MMKDLPSLISAVQKTADLLAEDISQPLSSARTVGDAGAVLERLRSALDAALDCTIVEPTDTKADLQTRLETINKIIRQAVDLSA